VLLVAVALAGLWLLHRKAGNEREASAVPVLPVRSSTEVHPNNGPTNLIAALVPKRAPAAAVRPPQFPLHVQRDQADLVVAEVRPAAEKGDAAAMRTLGEVLNECAHADMRSDGEIEAAAAKWSIDTEYLQKKGVDSFKGADLTQMAAGMSDAKKRLRDSCRKIPTEELKTASVWINRAADMGDEIAATDRAGMFAQRIADQSLSLEQREEARSQMIDVLEDQVAQGHCNDMMLNMFWKQSQDPMLVYIYGGILMRRGIAAIDSQPPEQRQAELASIEREERIIAAGVPPEQLAAAEATRGYIEANYCSNPI
jgi:hypothetical protein